MKEIKCTKCGEEAYTYKEFVSGKCRFCGDELEDDIEYDSTARDMGMDSEL
jgi:DNA-directed RNA polymerase subunit RPC12/RpoP